MATQIFFIFAPTWGKWSNFDEYFSYGLKPPTRLYFIEIFLTYRLTRRFQTVHLTEHQSAAPPSSSAKLQKVRHWLYYHVALLATNISPPKVLFEDDFPFPKVGYVRVLPSQASNISLVSCCASHFSSKDSIFHLDMGEFEPDTPKVVLCTQRC